jgi:GMP synthase (glutamine-hydrolysing)
MGLRFCADQLGGKVDASARREYGKAVLEVDNAEDLLQGLNGSTTVWMSHGDALSEIPAGFEPIAHTVNAPTCAIRNPAKKIYGVQFHPEVAHTPDGKKILSNFLFKVCGAKGDWTPADFIEQSIRELRNTVGSSRVLCALSGGVDSSVLAVLLHEERQDGQGGFASHLFTARDVAVAVDSVGLRPDSTYSYRVQAIRYSDRGQFSNVVRLTLTMPFP